MKSMGTFFKPIRKKAYMIILLLLIFSQIGLAQINLSLDRATLGQVINVLKSQTKYQFFYDDKLSDINVGAVHVKNANISQLLSQILKGKNVSYKVEDNIVYLSTVKTTTRFMSNASASVKTLSGTVRDKSGEPLIGVNVTIKGTTNGTMTDMNGKYSLKVTSPKGYLVFSYIGYKQQTVIISSLNEIDVVMAEDAQLVEEVVVTALGIKREKKMLGYAIQELKSDQLNKTGDPSLTSALQGKVAGLQMNMSSTGLSGSTKITLRGNSSLVDNNQHFGL